MFDFGEKRKRSETEDSLHAMAKAAKASGLIRNSELDTIPELVPVLSQGSEMFFKLAVQSMARAASQQDPQGGLAMMQRACMYLFAKGVEAVLLWAKSSDGRISMGFEPSELTTLDISTDLPPDQHRLAVDALGQGKLLFDAHTQFMIESCDDGRVVDEKHVQAEMRKTLLWIPRFAMAYAVARNYHEKTA